MGSICWLCLVHTFIFVFGFHIVDLIFESLSYMYVVDMFFVFQGIYNECKFRVLHIIYYVQETTLDNYFGMALNWACHDK